MRRDKYSRKDTERNYEQLDNYEIISLWTEDKWFKIDTNHAVFERVNRMIDYNGKYIDVGIPIIGFKSEHYNNIRDEWVSRKNIITDKGMRFIYDEDNNTITQYHANLLQVKDAYNSLKLEIPETLVKAINSKELLTYTNTLTEEKIKSIDMAQVAWRTADPESYTGKFLDKIINTYQKYEDKDYDDELRFLPIGDKRYIDLAASNIGAYVVIDDNRNSDERSEKIKDFLKLELEGHVTISHITQDIIQEKFLTEIKQERELERYKTKCNEVWSKNSRAKTGANILKSLQEKDDVVYVDEYLEKFLEENIVKIQLKFEEKINIKSGMERE